MVMSRRTVRTDHLDQIFSYPPLNITSPFNGTASSSQSRAHDAAHRSDAEWEIHKHSWPTHSSVTGAPGAEIWRCAREQSEVSPVF